MTTSLQPYDAVIIGGGHNGLVCACYLAARGLKVRVLERRHVLGGAAVTEEFHPGFRNSTASYTVSLLHPSVIRDLKLYEHGLRIVERPFSNFLPLQDGSSFLKLGGGLEATQREVAKFSPRDAERLPAYYAMLDRVVAVLRSLLQKTPPNIGDKGFATFVDWARAFSTSRQFGKLDLPGKRDLLALFTQSAGDLLDQWFESEPIKAALGFDSIVGHYASPYTPGSAYVLLHHVFGEVNGKSGTWGHAIGGMGAITQAMAKEALARGVELSVNQPVLQVLIKQDKAVGVVLEDGSEIHAKQVIANVNPKLLFGRMVAAERLPDDFNQRMQNYRCGSGTFRMNVALSELPDFVALPGTHQQAHHGAGIVLAPSLAYMEQAYFDARQYGWSLRPVVEMLIPSTVDDSLAPQGQHVASLFCQQFAPHLDATRFPQGWAGNADLSPREAAADTIIETVTRFAPNFQASVIARQIHSPEDLETKFGLVDGDIFHGKLSLDQLFSARPVLGHADYRTPVRNLYLCGSGTHPGGGVTGLPGQNAAREILRDN